MKSAICCFAIFTAALCAQSTAKLDADLMSLVNRTASRDAAAPQIADDILALADKDAQPSRQTVLDFADTLTRLMAGPQGIKGSSLENIKPISAAILDVLHSSGASSRQFHAGIDRFRVALFPFAPPPPMAKTAADRLFILGQEVHGPEDVPAALHVGPKR